MTQWTQENRTSDLSVDLLTEDSQILLTEDGQSFNVYYFLVSWTKTATASATNWIKQIL